VELTFALRYLNFFTKVILYRPITWDMNLLWRYGFDSVKPADRKRGYATKIYGNTWALYCLECKQRGCSCTCFLLRWDHSQYKVYWLLLTISDMIKPWSWVSRIARKIICLESVETSFRVLTPSVATWLNTLWLTDFFYCPGLSIIHHCDHVTERWRPTGPWLPYWWNRKLKVSLLKNMFSPPL